MPSLFQNIKKKSEEVANGVWRQANPFDGGKTYSNPNPNPQPQPQQQPTQVYNQPQQSSQPRYKNPFAVKPVQSPTLNLTRPKPVNLTQPSYGSGIGGLINRTRDTFDANTPQDQFKRQQAGQSQFAQPLQKTIAQGVVNTAQKVVPKNPVDAFTSSNPLLLQSKLAAPYISKGMNAVSNKLQSSTQNVPVVKSITKNVVSPMINSASKTVSNSSTVSGGKNPYTGNLKQQSGQFAEDMLNAASVIPVGAGVKATQAGIKASSKFLPQVAKSAGINTAFGAGYGASNAMKNDSSLKDIAKEAGVGGLIGGVTGAGIPLLGKGVSMARKPVQNALGDVTKQAGQAIDKATGAMGDILQPRGLTQYGVEMPMPKLPPTPSVASFAKRVTPDGDRYVELDRQILDNVPKESWPQTIRDTITNKFQGNKYDIGGDKSKPAIVNARSKNELSYQQPKMKDPEFIHKGNMTDNLDELVDTMHDVRRVENKKPLQKPNVSHYLSGRVPVKTGDITLYPRVDIEVLKNGSRAVHDIADIREFPGWNKVVPNRGDQILLDNQGPRSGNNIPQPPQNVNPIRGLQELKDKLKKPPTDINQDGSFKNPFVSMDQQGSIKNPLGGAPIEKTAKDFVENVVKRDSGLAPIISKTKQSTARNGDGVFVYIKNDGVDLKGNPLKDTPYFFNNKDIAEDPNAFIDTLNLIKGEQQHKIAKSAAPIEKTPTRAQAYNKLFVAADEAPKMKTPNDLLAGGTDETLAAIDARNKLMAAKAGINVTPPKTKMATPPSALLTAPPKQTRVVPQIAEPFDAPLTKTQAAPPAPPKPPTDTTSPKAIGSGQQKKTKFASETIPNSEFVSQPIKEATEKGAPLYTPKTEREGAISSASRLKAEGDEQFGYKVSQALDKKDISRQDAIDAQVYAAKLEQAGDDINISKASEIYDKLSAHYTKAGQLIQAAAMMSKRSPAGMKNYAKKQFDKAGVKVTPEIQKQVDTAIAKLAKTTAGTDANAQAMDEVLHAIAKNIPATKADLFINTWRANLLTAPTTTLGGFVGGVDTFINRKLWTNPIGTLVDMATSLFTGKRSMTMTGGFTEGAKKGVKTGVSKEYWKTGFEPMDGVTGGGKYDQPRDINFGDSKGGRVMGKYVNGVYRTMGLVDKPWKYGASGEALRSLAKAEGLNKGYKGNQLKQYVNEFVDNPPEEALNRANAEGKYAVFQDETAAGNAIGFMSEGFRRKGWHGAAAVVDFIVPFKQIPGSIATRIVKRTPIGTAQNIVEQIVNVKKGGQFDQRAFSQATAEGLSGIPIIGTGYALAQGGLVTGGYPSDDKERKLWLAEGKQPNSVKVGDRWYSLNYIQPFGALLNIGAGASQADKDGKEGMDIVWAGLATGGKSLSEMSFLQGITGVADALKNPTFAGERFVQNTASSVVPNFVRSFANASDKYERQASGIKEGIQSAIPGWRQGLPAKKDAFGNDVATKDNFLNRFVNPLKPSLVKGDETVAELRRLKDEKLGIMPSEANSNVFSKTDKLDKKQLSDLNSATASKVSEAWKGLIKTEDYKNMSDEDKKKTLASAKKDYAAVAKAEWAAKNNKINDEWQPDLSAKQKALASGNTPDYVYAGLPKDLNVSAKKTITESDGLSADDKIKWNAKENADPTVKEVIKSWNKGKDIPINNETAKLWAEYEKDRVSGKLSPLEVDKRKKAVLKTAYSSSLSDFEKKYYDAADDDIVGALRNGVIKQDSLKKALDVDTKLVAEGVIKSSGFGKKVWNELGLAVPKGNGSGGGYKVAKAKKGTKTSKGTKTKVAQSWKSIKAPKLSKINLKSSGPKLGKLPKLKGTSLKGIKPVKKL